MYHPVCLFTYRLCHSVLHAILRKPFRQGRTLHSTGPPAKFNCSQSANHTAAVILIYMKAALSLIKRAATTSNHNNVASPKVRSQFTAYMLLTVKQNVVQKVQRFFSKHSVLWIPVAAISTISWLDRLEAVAFMTVYLIQLVLHFWCLGEHFFTVVSLFLYCCNVFVRRKKNREKPLEYVQFSIR